jgi:cytochrome c-type biogenesis protein CcmH
MMRKYLVFLLVVLASLVIVKTAAAQNPTPVPPVPSADEVNGVAKKLYCPVCPNTPLDVCATQACKDWRGQIRDQLATGWSEKQVIDYFVAQYGERVLAEPQRSGFVSLVWALPVFAVLMGLVIVWLILKSWKANRGVGVPRQEPVLNVPPEVLARIEKELHEMD